MFLSALKAIRYAIEGKSFVSILVYHTSTSLKLDLEIAVVVVRSLLCSSDLEDSSPDFLCEIGFISLPGSLIFFWSLEKSSASSEKRKQPLLVSLPPLDLQRLKKEKKKNRANRPPLFAAVVEDKARSSRRLSLNRTPLAAGADRRCSGWICICWKPRAFSRFQQLGEEDDPGIMPRLGLIQVRVSLTRPLSSRVA